MNFYTLAPEGFEQVKSRLLKRMIALMGVTLSIALFVVVSMTMGDAGTDSSASLSATIGLAIAAWVLTFSGRRVYQRAIDKQQDAWTTYQLYLGPDYLVQRQAGRQDVKIASSQVTEVVEDRTRDLIVKTADKPICVCIPGSIKGYEEIRAVLATWKQIKKLP